MLLLIAARLPSGRTSHIVLAVAVALALLPLIAFTMSDLTRSAIVVTLMAALVLSLLTRGERRPDHDLIRFEEAITLVEQTRAMQVVRRPVAPVPTNPQATPPLRKPPILGELVERQRVALLLERASLLNDRADALLIEFQRRRVAVPAIPSTRHANANETNPSDV